MRVSKTEQTRFCEDPIISWTNEGFEQLELTRRAQVKNRYVLYFLVVGVFSAAPAFADRIFVNSAEQDGKSVAIHELLKEGTAKAATNALDFSRGALSETGFASAANISERDGRPILEALSSPKESKSKGDGRFILFDSSEKVKDKHKPKKQDGDGPPASFVAVPEPGSFTLVLFGLGALGVLLYRRNSL